MSSALAATGDSGGEDSGGGRGAGTGMRTRE